ncbi:MAG: DUF4931 domain-containing protein [Lachnospirales bacterium]
MKNNLYDIDFLTKEEVYIAPNRNMRPFNYKNPKNSDIAKESLSNCPFCDKDKIGDLVIENGTVRIIENKYPAIPKGYGEQFVMVTDYDHYLKLEDREWEYTYNALLTLRDFYNSIKDRFTHVQIFKNEGNLSGATLYHCHWQVTALKRNSPKNMTIYNSMKEYKEEYGFDYFNENNKDLYVVDDSGSTVLFAPCASKANLMCRIYSKRKVNSYGDLTVAELESFAKKIRKLILAYKDIYKDFSYNILFNDFNNLDEGYFYIEIMPRIGKFGGFELSTNAYFTVGYGEKTQSVLSEYFV